MSGAYSGLVLFDLLALAVGYAWLSGLRLASPIAGIGLAFFTGWMALGVALAIAVSLDVDPAPPQVVGAAAVAAGGGLALRRLRAGPHVPLPLPESRYLRLVAHAGIVLLVVAAVTALGAALRAGTDPNWDVWAFWEPKGKALYYFHGWDTGVGGASGFSHADYPPLVPATIAAQYHFMAGAYTPLLRLQMCLVELGFLGALVALLRPRVPAWLLYPGVAALGMAPRFWGRMPDVQPDQLLGCYVAVAAVALVLWLEGRRGEHLALATLALAAAALTKQEGLVLGAGLVACFAIAAAIRHGRPALWLGVALLGPLAIVPWKVWLARHGLTHVPADYSWRDLLRPGYLAGRTHRFVVGAKEALRFGFDGGLWAWELPLGLVAVALAAWRARAAALAIGAWMALALVGEATVYWIGRPGLQWYIETSAERVAGTVPIVVGSVLPLLLALSLPPSLGSRP